MNVSFEEVARASGVSRLSTLRRVTLPLMRPSIAAGVALVILYVVSDFGAVSLLRYQTLTYAVFQQMTGRSDNAAASILSLLLVGLALIFLITERWFRQRSRFYQTTGHYRAPQRHQYGWLGTVAVTSYLGLIVGAAFALPASLLVQWSLSPEALATLDNRFFGFVWNSGILAANAALYKRTGFDPEKDFSPITFVGAQANVLVVHPAVAALLGSPAEGGSR
jgi:iron(III) transport system permease protein